MLPPPAGDNIHSSFYQISVLFALMQMGNQKDYEKKINANPNAPPVGQANAHEHSNKMQ
jgi:hypothetical protein